MREPRFNGRILLFLAILSAALFSFQASAALNIISQGDEVFIGEEGLDITSAVGGCTQIAWFVPGDSPATDTPGEIIPTGNPESFYVAPVDFVAKTGNWYRWDGGVTRNHIAFIVVDPAIEIKVWDQYTNKDVTGKSVDFGNYENFRLESNIFPVVTRAGYNGEGFVHIHVTSFEGTDYPTLQQSLTVQLPLFDQIVDTSPWYWVPPGDMTQGWSTGVLDEDGKHVYRPGSYEVYAEISLNNIIDNYRSPGGAVYIGKARTATRTVTITAPTHVGSNMTLTLNSGWNFISIPRRLVDGQNTAETLFSKVDCGNRSIFLYKAETGQWDTLTGSDVVRPLDGIWIYSADTVQIPLTFKNWASGPSTTWLYPGWNAIGFSSTTPVSARLALMPLCDPPERVWSQLIGYNSVTQSYDHSIFNADPSFHSLMQPTRGYWIYMNGQDPPWELPALSA